MSNVVPFGKYRGKPIAELTADRKYCKWLAAQPWFRETYGDIYRLVSHLRSPDDTPEHNAFQARFLDPTLCLATAKSLGLVERLAEFWKGDSSFQRRIHEQNAEAQSLITSRPEMFEAQGWDVVLGVFCPALETRGVHSIWLELKPTVGDDYPSVLRQMQANRPSYDHFPSENHTFALVIDRFSAAGVTFDQVRAMFAASDFVVLMLSDIEAAIPAAPKSRRRRKPRG
jgi:uncharacterized protein (DUF3820 family)